MSRAQSSAPSGGAIDYFLLMRDAKSADKLVYYDKAGNCYEKEIDPKIVAEAFKVFDGKPKAVGRSTGGWSPAEPYQIVVHQPAQGEAQLRVRVLLHDLKFDINGRANEEAYLTQSKVVMPSELRDGLSYVLHHPQRFIIDFGQGPIPVQLFHCTQPDPKGPVKAFFVDTLSWEEALKKPERPAKTALQTFQCARNIIRSASEADVRKETKLYEAARENAAKLRAQGLPLFPEAFRALDPIEIPRGERPEDVRHYLRICLERGLTPAKIKTSVERQDDRDLLPFGLFE